MIWNFEELVWLVVTVCIWVCSPSDADLGMGNMQGGILQVHGTAH